MSSFVFQWPSALALLLVAIPLAALLGYARRQRRRVLESMGSTRSTHRTLRDTLRGIAWILLVLTLARPGYAPHYESTSQTGRDVVFALDVSQSMLAADAAPNRLEVAKQGIRDALNTFSSERVGLVVYAGSASILCPLTYDYDFVRYMLEQAHPRTVDFGGTTLQSAVEKTVDQVFVSERAGVQDLVILTDGGDHGSQMPRVEELLREAEASLLIVGLGNPDSGSPILVPSEDGSVQPLEVEGEVVLTRLEDSALRVFSDRYPNAQYIPAGTDPFHLGQLYIEYAKDKVTSSNDASSGQLVYQEAAIFFLIPALILLLLAECWGAKGLQFGQASLWLICLLAIPDQLNAAGANEAFRSDFAQCTKLMEAQQYEAAMAQFEEMRANQMTTGATAQDIAAFDFNRGLCLIQLSEAQAILAPRPALALAQEAQLAFLSAKALLPEFDRAGIRLELTANWIRELKATIQEQEADASEEVAQEESDADDMGPPEDFDDMYEDDMSDMDESSSDSSFNQSDFAAGAAMQELPTPNYSVEDILLEEQGNLQFRQQKRASANAAKVKKDY